VTPNTEGTFRGAGGVSIYWRRAAPAGTPRAIVLISHGYAEHVGRYEEFIQHLVGRGFAAAALDHRGHGRSEGPRGHCLTFKEFVADLHTLAGEAGRWWPGTPRILFGHSMGGLIATLYLIEHPDTARAAAVTGPALHVPDSRPAALRWIARGLALVAPKLAFSTALDQAALSRDPKVGEAYVADPLVHRKVTAGFVRAIAAAQKRALAEAKQVRTPLLILHGDADRLVEASGSSELARALSCPHEVQILPGYYHELLNEPPAERAKVLAALDRWFDRWL
jgi:alpha-beta hydrolase superfamily lysophospholipase